MPFTTLGFIVLVTAILLSVSQSAENERQERQLVSDTLWAEQAVSFEVQRVIEALQLMGRDGTHLAADGHAWRLRTTALIGRSNEVKRIELWKSDGSASLGDAQLYLGGDSANRGRDMTRVQAAIHRASTLDIPVADLAVGGARDSSMLIAVPERGDTSGKFVVVAFVSLDRLLVNTIPWWFVQQTRLSLDDFTGRPLAVRDVNVVGRGLYTHKIATQIADQTVYLSADSTRGSPPFIPNILTAAVVAMSILLGWTVYRLWRDLHLRIATEAELRGQQALREAMEASMVTGLRATDTRGVITYVNPAYCDLVGRTRDEMLGERASEGGDVGNPISTRLDDTPDRASPHVYETVMTGKAGEPIDVLVYEAPMRDRGGAVTGTMASILDITEQKRNAALLDAQNERVNRLSRLITMGEMASALAHEMNQPLTAINSYLSAGQNILETATDPDGRNAASKMLGKAQHQVDRAGLIIRRVRQFVQKSGPVPVALDLEQTVQDFLPLIKLQRIHPDDRVSCDFASGLPKVIADRVLLEQILFNLTKNAFEAMSHWPQADHQVTIFAERASDDMQYVKIGTRDSGPGLGDDAESILSSSFITTKADGMGIGLSVCRTALELLESRLVYRKLNDGAEFYFRLLAG